MASTKNPARDIVIKACQEHPEMPSFTLAKMLYRGKEKKLFTSFDALRSQITYYRGRRTGGKKKDGTGRSAKDPIPATVSSSQAKWEYKAPKSLAEDYSDFVVHGAQRVLRLSDIHFPLHDERALEASINYGIKKDPTVLLLDGDIIDCHSISRYDKDPRHRYTETELRMIADQFSDFRKAFPKARIIYKSGNHEFRIESYLLSKAPELFGLPGMDLPGLISMVNGPESIMGVEFIGDNRTIRMGHLSFLHGHEFRGGGGVNPARWIYLRTGVSCIIGHFHKTSEHSEPNLHGSQIGCWSTGCLCELRPQYDRKAKWNHGFAYVDVDSDGMFNVENRRIIDGKVK